tara:strand:+ start:111 stop:953 length:843 start_codon:yes stop_codon:yes gene_type:complete
MKKFTSIFLITLLIFSCSSESDSDSDNNNNDNNNNNNNEVALFPSQISYNDIEVSEYTYQEDFTYEGDKIVQILRSSFYNGSLQGSNTSEFIYANNLISRIDYFNSSTLSSRTYLEYDSQGRLTSSEYCNGSSNNDCDSSTTFTYNGNGSITVNAYYENTLDYTATVELDNNGNIISVSDSGGCTYITSLEYDNYHGPFKNIVGLDPIMMVENEFTGASIIGYTNNVTSQISEGICDDDSESFTETISYNYDYNDEGYPRNIVVSDETFGGEETIIITYN